MSSQETVEQIDFQSNIYISIASVDKYADNVKGAAVKKRKIFLC